MYANVYALGAGGGQGIVDGIITHEDVPNLVSAGSKVGFLY